MFERLPLAGFGNRIPQIQVEIIRPVGRLETMIRAVTLIPGATEFGYDTRAVSRVIGRGAYETENRHAPGADTDIVVSLDRLQALCPALERIALVVTWFGTDLRAGHCRIEPRVDRTSKSTTGAAWSVAGRNRASAAQVSRVDGRPAFGGTPSDSSILRAIAELKARGLKVTLVPFVMMDIATGNALGDPWTGSASQPAYPWRGRITCDPAPGRPGSPDGTAAATAQVAALFGSARADHFTVSGSAVSYSGPSEWTLSRMVLHCAALAKAAGGVDAILVGSEFEALTRVRSGPGAYPAVDQLVALAAEVKRLAGSGTKISYAANWSEYGADVRAEWRRGALSARSAVGLARHRHGGDRLVPAARRLARRRPPRLRARRHAARARLSRRQHPRRRGVRLVLCRRRRAAGASPHADRRRRVRQALGVPPEGSRRLVDERAP